jgi:nucleoside-diphosphate-sugar epimerase
MERAMGRPARLLPVPARWLKLAAALVGKPDVAQRMCGSLQVDIEKTRRLLGWSPPLSLDEGLRRAVRGRPCPNSWEVMQNH